MKSRLITLTAACLAFTSLAFAQEAPGKDGDWHKRRHHKRGNPVERLTRTLDLNADQQAKIQAIFDQARPQMKAARQEAREKMRAVREQTMAQIRPILTPEQQQKFDALQKARENMRKARQEMRDAMKQ